MTPLGALISECQQQFEADHGVELTYGDIARRSGGRLSRQRVQQLAKDPVKAMPTPVVIEGLRRGLQAPYSVVLTSALASAGYDVPSTWHRDEVSSGAPMSTPPTVSGPHADAAAEQEAYYRRLARKTHAEQQERANGLT